MPWPGGAIDFGWLCSTQPAIAQNGFVVLEDDLDTQPAGEPRPRSSATTSWPRSRAARRRSRPSSTRSRRPSRTEVLTELGVRVAIDQEDIEDVAADFLAGLDA